MGLPPPPPPAPQSTVHRWLYRAMAGAILTLTLVVAVYLVTHLDKFEG